MESNHPVNLDREFHSTGIAVIRDFIGPDRLVALNQELDILFSRPSVNGSLQSTYFCRGYWGIFLPTISIRSVNLLEMALSVRNQFFELLPEANEKKYTLTAINIFSEEDNPEALGWHTDNRKGMIRAQVYLRGGQSDSGAFRFMLGTHERDYDVDHYLTKEKIKELSPRIREYAEPPGSIIFFDSNGFHSKAPCIKSRRTIIFELQPGGTDYTKSSIYLASGDLTHQVIENINFFMNGHPKNVFAHGGEENFRKSGPLPFGFAAKMFLLSLEKELRAVVHRGIRAFQYVRKFLKLRFFKICE